MGVTLSNPFRKEKEQSRYDLIDITNEADQDYILRKIGEMKANMIEQSPADLADDMGMPDHIVEWLEENFAYFLIGAKLG